MEPIYTDVQGACEALSIKRSTLFNLLKDGQLRSIRLGGRRLIPIAAVREFAEQLEASQAEAA